MSLNEVSTLLDKIQTPMTLVTTPINLESEREKFFNSETYNPQFKYSIYKNNNDKILNELSSVQIISGVDPRISDFHIDLIESKNLVNKMYYSIGDNDDLTKYSKMRYGMPSELLFKNAAKVLKNKVKNYHLISEAKVKHSKYIEKEQIVSSLEKVLKHFGLDDWQIVFSKRTLDKNIRVGVKSKYIVLGSEDIRKRAIKLRKTIVHEIGTHVFRWYNANLSGIPALTKSNLKSYQDIEEGLATYNEDISDLLDYKSLKQRALLTYAIYIGEGLTFRQLYNVLVGFVPTYNAFKIALRVKRGLSDTSQPGIYPKDVSYFRGYRKVRRKLQEDVSLYNKLYAGKISLDQVSWVDDGLIPKPKLIYNPE
ncbi:MAG TPA: tyrosine/phenylalanine carboxypeptidase domain-containing protein, partial [Candidatus Dojkabacteria bacterium]|nr:tyrosine/phenylalanine carboxypeptidase domain-containing protein [Candidatus Dojkabacteria bacterium]